MNEVILQGNTDFKDIYGKSYRLAAAVFMVSNVMDQNEELRAKIKSLSLQLISVSVSLKDINILDSKKLTLDLEKISLELMSMLDIASVSGLISKMNGNILKEEFQSFILELGRFSEKSEENKNTSVKSIFVEPLAIKSGNHFEKINPEYSQKVIAKNLTEGGNGHNRKEQRRNTVLEFIKRHNVVSIKDIVPNITGCSEKTVQRELILLINEGKIKKTGERRWSKYSIV